MIRWKHQVVTEPWRRRYGAWTGVALGAACTLLASCANAPDVSGARGVTRAELEEVLGSGRDVWGEAAMRRPSGPSYECFENLLPPLRYVDAAFHHYPIVLGAPMAACKARFVSNGSAVNAKGQLRSWHDAGYPVTFRVGTGAGEVRYGADLANLDGPRYVDGHLPIVRLAYRHEGAVYEEEAFAAVDEQYRDHGVVFVRFTLRAREAGQVNAHVNVWGRVKRLDDRIMDDEGRVYVWFGPSWGPTDMPRPSHAAELSNGQSAVLAVFTEPIRIANSSPLSLDSYDEQRRVCAERWASLLRRGACVALPEARVDAAWRALVLGTFACVKGDHLGYSAANAYERQYVAECGDAVMALASYGFVDEARATIPPLLGHAETIRGKQIGFHNAGFKLQLLASFYWLTRDADFVGSQRDHWQREASRIVGNIGADTGLLPRENYAGDIFEPVYSLNTNAACWRGLRDLAVVLRDIGEPTDADRYACAAASLRQAIHRAVRESERCDVQPPFVPNALFGEETPYASITESERGSYWNLLIPYVLGSRVFGPDDPREGWILDYLHERGGLSMGMTRIDLHADSFAGDDALDDLYGLRYVLTLLRRDDVDRALVSFYGKLAQGLTRDTCIGAECTRLIPEDGFGRAMGLPPNSASNAMFLSVLRNLLVQDWDLDDDGRPETLRLLYATPPMWLRDGASIRAERMPTAFGPVSIEATSRLSQGEVSLRLILPERLPERAVVRVRVPPGWRVIDAIVGTERRSADSAGAIDVSGRTGEVSARARVRRL
jgi:hypothetical protein